eukprot:CFRG3613T1
MPTQQAAMLKLYSDVISEVITSMKQEFENDGVDEAILAELQQVWEYKMAGMLEEGVEEDESTALPASNRLPITAPESAPPTTVVAQVAAPQLGHYDDRGNYVAPAQGNTDDKAVDQVDGAYDTTTDVTVLGCAIAEASIHTTHTQKTHNTPNASTSMRTNTISTHDMDGEGENINISSTYTTFNSSTAHPKNMRDKIMHTITSNNIPPTSTRKLTRAEIDNRMYEHITNKNTKECSAQGNMAGTFTFEGLMAVPQVDGDGEDSDLGSDLGTDLESNDDEEPDTDNLILCQYDKVTRTKTKWKATLKNGMMRINNRDYVFHKANGEFEWV